jgi:hypothetical protein
MIVVTVGTAYFEPQPSLEDSARFVMSNDLGHPVFTEQGRQPYVQPPTWRTMSSYLGPSDRVAQLYPQAPGTPFIAFYDSHGCGGGILTRLHTDK